ncbi:MAG: hypothetical protein FWH33_00155 [Oscillospiraceae bacterium]|nr:hypothetical protein [Oscillospiraceae bacterium]
MKFEYSDITVSKMGAWAESLADDIDFIDYWFNLFMSKTKARIESDPMDNINAFYWNRWKNDFEIYVDKYTPIPGNGYHVEERFFLGWYMQYVVYALRVPSKLIAEFYGKEVFRQVLDGWFKYHTFGSNLFMVHFVDKFGLPPDVVEVHKLNR